MILSVRKTHGFIEIKAEENETIIFKSNPNELQQAIDNLLLDVEDLASYTDKTVQEHLKNLNSE